MSLKTHGYYEGNEALHHVMEEGLVWCAAVSAVPTSAALRSFVPSSVVSSAATPGVGTPSHLSKSSDLFQSAAPQGGAGTRKIVPQEALSFGVQEIDSLLPHGGLVRGALHEIILEEALPLGSNLTNHSLTNRRPIKGSANHAQTSLPPLSSARILPAMLAGSCWREIAQALEKEALEREALQEEILQKETPPKETLAHNLAKITNKRKSQRPTIRYENFPYLVWIGKDSWPTPFFLEQLAASFFTAAFLAEYPQVVRELISERCLFIDTPTRKLHLWALESVLKTKGIGVVIADGKCLSESSKRTSSRNASSAAELRLRISRRLSLAARSNNTTLLLLNSQLGRSSVKSEEERETSKNSSSHSSSAHSKWIIRPHCSASLNQSWEIELARVKGSGLTQRAWKIELLEEQDHETTLSLRILPLLVNRSDPSYAEGSDQHRKQSG